MAEFEVEPDGEPDRETPCPHCDGTLAVWVDRVGEGDGEQCAVTAFVHREG